MTINVYADTPLTLTEIVEKTNASDDRYTGLRFSRQANETKKRGHTPLNTGDSITFWTKDDAAPEEQSSLSVLVTVLESALTKLRGRMASPLPATQPPT